MPNKEKKPAAPFRIEAADGTIIEIPPGEYYINTKARARRQMENSLSADARRVYACLELASMGFQRELAVTMERGKTRPLTPADISEQTGLSRQHVRSGLRELEDEGLAKREAPDGGTLRRGQVVIYCWSTPRETGKKFVAARSYNFPAWYPPEWEPLKALITRRKLQISLDEESARSYIQEGQEVARSYKEAEIVAARFLERVCAPPPKRPAIRKKELKERLKDNPHPPTPSPAQPNEEEEDFSPSNGKPKPTRPTKPAPPPPPPPGDPPPRPAAEPGNSSAFHAEFNRVATPYPDDQRDYGKSAKVWRTMTPEQKTHAIAALPDFLECERWKKTPQFIPFLSTWLKDEHYEYPPPRYWQPKNRKDAKDFGLPPLDEARRNIEEAEEAERRRKSTRRNGGQS